MCYCHAMLKKPLLTHDEIIHFYGLNAKEQEKYRAKKWAERYKDDTPDERNAKLVRWTERFGAKSPSLVRCQCCDSSTQADPICYRCQFWAESIEIREELDGDKACSTFDIAFGRYLEPNSSRAENRMLTNALNAVNIETVKPIQIWIVCVGVFVILILMSVAGVS